MQNNSSHMSSACTLPFHCFAHNFIHVCIYLCVLYMINSLLSIHCILIRHCSRFKRIDERCAVLSAPVHRFSLFAWKPYNIWIYLNACTQVRVQHTVWWKLDDRIQAIIFWSSVAVVLFSRCRPPVIVWRIIDTQTHNIVIYYHN